MAVGMLTCGLKRLNFYAGHQVDSDYYTRGESEESIVCRLIVAFFETQGRQHLKSKTLVNKKSSYLIPYNF